MKKILAAWLVTVLWGGAYAQEVSPSPGTYPSPLTVTVAVPPGAALSYRFLETPGTQTFPWTSPLTLEALGGETRTYTLRLTIDLPTGETTTKDYRFEVSKPVDPQATVTPVPGTFTAAVTVQPKLPPEWSLTLDGRPTSGPQTLDTAPGSTRVFLLAAQRPGREPLNWVYTLDRRDQEALSVDLLSPLPGVWNNPQALVAAFQGVDRVLWSYGPHLDPSSARVYDGPLVLDHSGVQTLTVAGHSRRGDWIEKTVTWTNGVSAPPVTGWPASGVQLTGLDLPEAPGFTLSWDDGRSWQSSQALHREAPSSTSRKVLAVQVKKDGVLSRYVWWLDARPPQQPTLRFVGGWNPQLLFTGSSEALHRVTWTRSDGKIVEDVPLWGPLGAWKVPDGVVGARVMVQGLGAVQGPPATIGFSETGWSTPGWEPWDNRGPQTDRTVLPLGGRVPPRPGFRAAYEVSQRPDVPEPGTGSAWLDGAFLPSVPWGADRTFYVRFAWRDDAGLTGPASPVVAVRVDRVPPLAPEVGESGGQVLVKAAEGEEEGASLFWAVTAERVESAAALTFQPYRTALASEELRAGVSGKLWFHAQAQDRSGNFGPARLNVALAPPTSEEGTLVQVDPDPTVGETAVQDGGVYPWPQFRLRALEQNRDLWVGVSDQGTVPSDWKARLQPWTGVFSRGVGRGERRTFQVFWNLKGADGWAWTQPKTLSLTLDQGPPAPPLVSEPWPLEPRSSSWSLALRPGRQGDLLRYSYTLDGSLPPDPKDAGALWPGSRSWDAPPQGKVIVRIRVTAVSVSGLSLEMPPGPAVTIDKTIPEAVVPGLEPFSYKSAPFVVPLSSGAPTVRYILTSDGGAPGVPSATSPVLIAPGLVLEGKPGQTTLYRFRWRPFSAAGLPGPTSDTFAVLIDRTAPSPPVATGDPDEKLPLPHLKGLPESGISSSPVTLDAEGWAGLLRFEVREGLGSPRPVTAQSAVWETPLVLDPGPGVDRSYAVSVEGFTPEGKPLTDEVRYLVRIDRSVPEAPVYDLVADTRRAEAILAPAAGNSEETLVYRWSWDSFPQGHGEISWQTLGNQPPRFIADGGALTHLRVQAYLRDEAGNQGPVLEKVILVDQNVVYVTPRATGDGSRIRPVGTVVEALDLARLTGKSVVFFSEGTYPVSRTADVGGLRFYGGLNPELWEATTDPSRSVWMAQVPFSGLSLVESGERDWALSRIDLSTGSAVLDRVVVVRGAAVNVRDSAFTWAQSGGWDQVGGSLDWTDVAALYSAQPRGTFLDLKSSQGTVRGLNVAATQTLAGPLFSMKDTSSLFQDLVIVSKSVTGFDAVWSATGGRLTMNNARILAGDGAGRSSAFVLKDTDATFFNTDISLYGTSSNTGFQATGGKLELQKSNVSLLRGDEFNQAVVIDHGDVLARTFQIKVETGSYQGGFSIDGGTLTLGSGKVLLAGGGQRAWGAQFLDSALVVVENVDWVLGTKTAGEVWKVGKPWLEGSKVTDSTTTGW